VITDTLANTNGAVFFTTFKPSSDLCNYGGNSLLWAVRYDTGGTPPAAAMKGKALMQVSTGAFKEITLSSAFSNPGSTRYDGRRLNTPITGVPPTAQGLSLFSNPPPIKKIIQIQEK
jgi:type IV pilus assembly protein PilY1